MADEKKAGTEYMALYRNANEGPWEELGTLRAGSEAAAKQKALKTWKPEGGWIVAVPARSWKPENKTPELRFK